MLTIRRALSSGVGNVFYHHFYWDLLKGFKSFSARQSFFQHRTPTCFLHIVHRPSAHTVREIIFCVSHITRSSKEASISFLPPCCQTILLCFLSAEISSPTLSVLVLKKQTGAHLSAHPYLQLHTAHRNSKKLRLLGWWLGCVCEMEILKSADPASIPCRP